MARYTVEVVKGGSLDRLQNLQRQLRAALVQIGQTLTNRAQETFSLQGYNRVGKGPYEGVGPMGGKFPWPERANPNIPAIIADLQRKTTLPARRFTGRPAVMDLGRLQASINWHLISKETVEVGTNLPYASLQQFGGVREIAVTQTVKDNLAVYLRKSPHKRPQLGWLFGVDKVEWHTLPRPFVVVDKQDREDINRILLDTLGAM